MGCPHCESADTRERRDRTDLGSGAFGVGPGSGSSMSGLAQGLIICVPYRCVCLVVLARAV